MKLWTWKHSIQHKTILAVVLVGLLPALLLLLLTYIEERKALREAIGSNFKGMAVEVARKIETQIIRGVNEAQQLATIPFIRSAVTEANRSYEGKTAEQVQTFIAEWQERWRQRTHPDQFPAFVNQIAINYLIDWHAVRKSDYLAIVVTDNQGVLVLSSFPQVKFYQGDAVWWRAAFHEGRGQTYVSDLSFDPSFGTHVLHVAVPIFDERFEGVVGAISILLRRDSLFRSISEVSAGSTGHAMLMASNGVPLICPVRSLEEHSMLPSLVDAINKTPSGWVQAVQDSHGAQDALVGFARLRFGDTVAPESFGGQSWVTFVRQDPEETYAPLGQLLAKVAVYGIMVFVLLWLAGLFVARRIVHPIQSLHEGVHRIGRGNLDDQLVVTTGDEIEDLAHAFNKMAANLKQSFAQLNEQMQEIRQLEEKYRDLIEHSPEMIHQIDKDGRFVHVNKTELDKLGYTLDEMLQMNLWDIVPLEQKPAIIAYCQHLPRQGKNIIETIFVSRDAVSIDVEIHSTALIDSTSRELVYTRAFVRDITERRILQTKVQRYTTELEEEVSKQTQQLSESEQRYRVLFNLAADSIVVVDADGCITAANEREQEVFGYTESELLGRSFLTFVCENGQSEVKSLFEQVVHGAQQIPTKEILVSDVHHEIRPVEMDMIRVGEKAELFVIVQLRDITERKQLEKQLRKYREELEEKVQERTKEIQQTKYYLESLLENANDVIYTLDIDQRFTYVNSQVAMWGYRKEDLIGRPYLSLLSKRHRGRRLKDTLDIGAKQEYEVEFVSRAGEHRSVVVSVSPLRNEKGAVSGVLGIARDVTERKRFDRQIRNTERLASVGKLAAGVAHEINNPLGGMLNCLYNIRKGTLSPARQEEYLTYMDDGLRRAQQIVRQLLDFSQQHEPEPTLSNLMTIVERVLVLTDHTITEKHLTLVKEYDQGLPQVLVDPHMIQQVVMNLVLNAVQATAEGGRITIRLRRQDDACEVDVVDTGAGIPSDIRPHIFDPFFTTKPTGEGTGLGLSVSLGIVERHDGQLLVESEVGIGTIFTVRLPIVAGAFTMVKGR